MRPSFPCGSRSAGQFTFIEQCVFERNIANVGATAGGVVIQTLGGGALGAIQAALDIRHTMFRDNESLSRRGGGAILMHSTVGGIPQTRHGQYDPNGNLLYFPETSPRIDTGTNRAWMAQATDLRGFPRIRRGIPRSPGTPRVDMGAYEVKTPPVGTIMFFR